jgi:Right handed beta helix region
VRRVPKGVSIRGSFVAKNNVGNGGSHGIYVGPGVSDFIIQGCRLTNTYAITGLAGTQTYGVYVATGASDRYIVADNLVSGNVSGGVSDNGSGGNKRVANNY